AEVPAYPPAAPRPPARVRPGSDAQCHGLSRAERRLRRTATGTTLLPAATARGGTGSGQTVTGKAVAPASLLLLLPLSPVALSAEGFSQAKRTPYGIHPL